MVIPPYSAIQPIKVGDDGEKEFWKSYCSIAKDWANAMSRYKQLKRGNTNVKDLLELNPSIDPGTKTIYAGSVIIVPYKVWVGSISNIPQNKPFLD